MEVASGTGAEDAVVLETTWRGVRGVRRLTVTVRYALVRALHDCLAPVEGAAPAWQVGLLFGSATEDGIILEGTATSAEAGQPIGIFRAQSGGWATFTDADRKRLKKVGLERGLLLVVRTLAMRPWSATLFAAGGMPETEPPLIEFPLDEYVLRQGWQLDAPEPGPLTRPPVCRGGRGRWWAAGAALLLAGAAAVSWQAQRTAKRAAEPAAGDRVERRLGLQASRSGEDFEISWNRLSDEVRRAAVGTLTIRNGSLLRVVALRPQELRENRILVHPLPGRDLELQLELVDGHGVTQTDTIELLAPAGGHAWMEPEVEEPKPSPLDGPPRSVAVQSTTSAAPVVPVIAAANTTSAAATAPVATTFPAAPATSAAADRLADALQPEPHPIQPVRAEVPASREAVAIRRVNPGITPKVRAEIQRASGAVKVTVQVSINAAGNVDGAVVLSSTGEPSPSGPYIRLASLDAARRWKFRPATEGGHPVPSKTTLVFDF